MSTEIMVPAEVQSAYFNGEHPEIEQITAGDLATVTYRATAEDGERFILQRMAPDFARPALVRDFEVVTDHLAERGWEVPRLVKTLRGNTSLEDRDSHMWRVMTNINSDPVTPTHPDGAKVGALLGQLHIDLADLDYEPEFSLPHFHDTPFIMETLRRKNDSVTDEGARYYRTKVLNAYLDLDQIGDPSESQLIHADPRTANVLFRDGEPFTFIDFDTLTRGSIWTDMGDFLRSLAEDAEKDGRIFTIDELGEVVEAYRLVAQPEADADEFRANAVKSMKLISLELAARFLNDIDGDYFGTAPGFDSHAESNIYRVGQQWDIHQLFNVKEAN